MYKLVIEKKIIDVNSKVYSLFAHLQWCIMHVHAIIWIYFCLHIICQKILNYAPPYLLCKPYKNITFYLSFITFKIMWKNNNLRKANKVSVEILIERGAYFKPLSLSQFSVNNFVHINSQHQSHHSNNNKSYNNNHIVLDSIPHPLEAEPTSKQPICENWN